MKRLFSKKSTVHNQSKIAKMAKAIQHDEDMDAMGDESSVFVDESQTFFWGELLQAGLGYWLVMSTLAVIIVVTSVMISKQTQERHEVYRLLGLAKKESYTLQIERQRLVLEQQTFSTTPTVAKRAFDELGMFYPAQKDKLLIIPKTDMPKLDAP